MVGTKASVKNLTAKMDLETLFGVKGKNVLITGGGSGIGYMMASGLLQNGANVIIAARKKDVIDKSVADLSKNANFGAKVYGLQAAVSTKAGCDKLAKDTAEIFDHLDVLLNNAGTSWGSTIDAVPEKKGWDGVYDLNVKSIFFLTVALMPLLAKEATNRKHSSVINISSTAGLKSDAKTLVNAAGTGMWSYNSSKAAVIHLTRNLAVDLAPKFITCNCICPGVYPSKLTAFGISQHEAAMLRGQPMNKMGEPEDITGLAMSFIGRSGSHLTGNFIATDGGASL